MTVVSCNLTVADVLSGLTPQGRSRHVSSRRCGGSKYVNNTDFFPFFLQIGICDNFGVPARIAKRSRNCRKLGIDGGCCSQSTDARTTVQTRVVSSTWVLKVGRSHDWTYSFFKDFRYRQLQLIAISSLSIKYKSSTSTRISCNRYA